MADFDPNRSGANGEGVSDRSSNDPWQQKFLDNFWILLALGVVIPGVLYLGWGLWELAELPTWGGR